VATELAHYKLDLVEALKVSLNKVGAKWQQILLLSLKKKSES
jgi:hypothetical protein